MHIAANVVIFVLLDREEKIISVKEVPPAGIETKTCAYTLMPS